MKIELVETVLDMFPSLERAGITGGEPLLCKDFWNIIELLRDKDLPTNFSTNGVLLKKNDLLKGTAVAISARASTPEEYKHITGSDDFFKMVRGVEIALESGANTGITFVIYHENAGRLTDYAKFARDLGVRRVAFMALLTGGRPDINRLALRAEDMPLIEAQRDEVYAHGFTVSQWPKTERKAAHGYGCTMATRHLAVDADGNVALCCRGEGPRPAMGNIWTDGEAVWSSGPMAELRSRVFQHGNQPQKCIMCRENCRTECF